LVAQGVSQVSYADVTIKTDVNAAIQGYLLERQRQFPGVVMQQSSLRHYPLGTTAAQLFGTVGPITQPELGDPRFKGVPQTDTVGQSGLEFEYNQYLQGHDGSEKVTVNAQGQVERTVPGTEPVAGESLKLSIDTRLQQAGQQALATSIADNPGANGGAFVALDPTNGQVLAMGSNPTFNPSIFTHPITQSKYDAMFGPSSGSPLINRAIQSAGPTGSTFKVITATAALQSGDWSPSEVWDDTGQFCFPNTTDCLHNSGHASYGAVALVQAIQFSVDTFFYNLGLVTNVDPTTHPNGGPLQQWAKLLGIGRSTGIDLPGETTGTRPSPAWRAARNGLESQCEHATGPFKGHPKHPASQGGCGIADGAPWTEGDNVNMAVGQGDVQVSPLQLAIAYSALANGGTIVTPHVGMDVESSTGNVMQAINPAPRRHLAINPAFLDEIRTGLRDAASQPGGTSYDVMGNFPQQVYGKTGTAQYNGQPDYGWYACFVPPSATSKPIVVVVTVQRGGFGDVAAAPVARQILSQWFYGKPGAFIKGQSTTL
jgi:penicillin-binding protein 2